MIEEIIRLRTDGLSFRKIATELNTTVGKVQYRWHKWLEENEDRKTNNISEQQSSKETNSSEYSISPALNPLKGELLAKLVTPRKILLFWDTSELPKKIIERFFNQKFEDHVTVIRIYDVTEILFNGKNAHHFNEITVPYQSGHWFIKGLAQNHSYISELGLYVADNQFFPLLRSNCIQTTTPDLQIGDTYQQELLQLNRYEEEAPKWMEQVSTYSYYLKSRNLGEQHE
ncbi:DUF4912 domain-containing protein [Neobacillus cucumis]|uniref:DUF4912 domain-containing protein n=1 Tax=Neobacillus cucumis TaxID=1740721 RepID=UPI001963B206|nr:DUF4912 domain-containing protein [Neobacillus cucumis]MBM7651636.1 hypothetical protein [Neobacillus cucumis]